EITMGGKLNAIRAIASSAASTLKKGPFQTGLAASMCALIAGRRLIVIMNSVTPMFVRMMTAPIAMSDVDKNAHDVTREKLSSRKPLSRSTYGNKPFGISGAESTKTAAPIVSADHTATKVDTTPIILARM